MSSSKEETGKTKAVGLTDHEDLGSPMVVGLTGGIGTGKTTAAAYLAAHGLMRIDADAISRRITEKIPGVRNPVLEEISRVFDGSEAQRQEKSKTQRLIRPDGSLDRRAMAALVFSDPAKKELLEGILFREIIAEIKRQIKGAKDERILLDVPLLFESGLDSLCDHIIVITADHDTRIRRVMERDGCSAADVEARIRNQMPDEEKIPRADFVVDNSGSKEQLMEQLDRVLGEL